MSGSSKVQVPARRPQICSQYFAVTRASVGGEPGTVSSAMWSPVQGNWSWYIATASGFSETAPT